MSYQSRFSIIGLFQSSHLFQDEQSRLQNYWRYAIGVDRKTSAEFSFFWHPGNGCSLPLWPSKAYRDLLMGISSLWSGLIPVCVAYLNKMFWAFISRFRFIPFGYIRNYLGIFLLYYLNMGIFIGVVKFSNLLSLHRTFIHLGDFGT